MRQTNIYDYLEDKDWIDQPYFVWKAKQKNEWTEYSPKFLSKDDAKEWRLTHGENLVQRFDRQLKLFTARPSDNMTTYKLIWEEEIDHGMFQFFTKRVPGECYDDACDNLKLFVPKAKNINLLTIDNN